jgi:hypothetical protein
LLVSVEALAVKAVPETENHDLQVVVALWSMGEERLLGRIRGLAKP